MLGFFIDGRESMKVRRGFMNCVVFWAPSQYYGAIMSCLQVKIPVIWRKQIYGMFRSAGNQRSERSATRMWAFG